MALSARSLPNAELLAQAQAIAQHPRASVSVVGRKPWRERAVAKLLGPTATVLLYAAALSPLHVGVATLGAAGTAGVAADMAFEDRLGLRDTFLMSPVALPDLLSVSIARHPADIPVTPDMTDHAIVEKLSEGGHYFQALAITIEGMETKPYRDGCGLNIGMGYCVTARLSEYGVERVVQDLNQAGLPADQVQALVGNDRKAQDKVEISRGQALALLNTVALDYRTTARDTVGGETFDALPVHRQAALTWLAYNTGDGMAKFNRLLTAVREDRAHVAVRHMTPFFEEGGRMVANSRAGSWLMAAYWSEESLKAALANPDKLETSARQGISPLQAVAPVEAGRLLLRGELPPSPYVTHGQVEGDVVPVTTTAWRQQRGQETAPTAPRTTGPKSG